MDQHFLSIEQFDELLHQWIGFPIIIEKIELQDKDEIQMHLDHINYAKNTPSEDGYQGIYALQLNGEGTIQTMNDNQPLPEHIYEIPIEETSLYEFNGSQFLLSTERGIYKMKRLEKELR
ncbi:MAG TPA: hypothetical protein VK119_03745 [Bacillota bacterium]|nr:hypothetical protein [Bacillota bacterium]